MSHKHESCTAYGWGIKCTEGRLTGYCDYDTCYNEYCSDLGHCECLCHSGKTCGCGHAWPRMLKQEKGATAAPTAVAVTDPMVDPVTTTAGIPLMTRDWTELLLEQYKRVKE